MYRNICILSLFKRPQCHPSIILSLQLQVMEIVEDETTGFEGLQLCKFQTRPRTIYTCSKMDDEFIKVLRGSVFKKDTTFKDYTHTDNQSCIDSAVLQAGQNVVGEVDEEEEADAAMYDVRLEKRFVAICTYSVLQFKQPTKESPSKLPEQGYPTAISAGFLSLICMCG